MTASLGSGRVVALVMADQAKLPSELRRSIAIVVAMQFVALAYGTSNLRVTWSA